MTDLREKIAEIVRGDSDFTEVRAWYPEADAILALFEDTIKDAEIGRRWRGDSSLETWFPYTAEELARLRAQLAEAQRELSEKCSKAHISDQYSNPYEAELAEVQRERDEAKAMADGYYHEAATAYEKRDAAVARADRLEAAISKALEELIETGTNYDTLREALEGK